MVAPKKIDPASSEYQTARGNFLIKAAELAPAKSDPQSAGAIAARGLEEKLAEHVFGLTMGVPSSADADILDQLAGYYNGVEGKHADTGRTLTRWALAKNYQNILGREARSVKEALERREGGVIKP